ncbi:hypothetical protein A3A76_01895 [Candidatus Woesebacteria bacterium RIFCSPLOWO2_01_FULL_39_23]|uniref:N-acetyltransferase domain-containing protein n=1 Tax=Candidatus Woesebacteria bacterium RIFCSPHIGHO2_01_FULL_40_22 TaxID=1802499 RepID=A0A1F7YHJ5_9BACT|nr:MAG: hypothetical protein A2141_05255 [Candidatus Woesebacteria bacterium RBG_16_40_11]OGM26349.1 MAG: hypothetical protein A2628_03240 [Candidatus Woesebacteria bacterium RIFCSPHIGHO2_01_FULL_40_22]OGM37599.1 MAG: hypothetical protein A3E41_05215 [Candidatus Woesebacteria bacterium RIFCSPHIGHO2_12_FULL_38_9]OGM61892.1 MAG: hypothetical protein A3A76_01895 [Candidatus Woesebacteria bacterium RIFCSPLOWO2_01_FULL_39_23]
MDIIIKSAKSKDWKIIQRLNDQVILNDLENDDDIDLNWSASEEGIKSYQEIVGGDNRKCYIAYLNNEPIGFVALSIKDFGYRKSKYIEIEKMGVDQEFRSKGIGKMLMDESIRWAKEQKATKLYVSAYWGNKRARDFYKKNGFYESGVEMDKKI